MTGRRETERSKRARIPAWLAVLVLLVPSVQKAALGEGPSSSASENPPAKEIKITKGPQTHPLIEGFEMGEKLVPTPIPTPTPPPPETLPKPVFGSYEPPKWLFPFLFPNFKTLGNSRSGAFPLTTPVPTPLPPPTPVPTPTPSPRATPSPTPPGKPVKPSLVDLNSATREELTRLLGIDPYRAELIVFHRRSIGGFKNVGQLREVFGISEKLYLETAPKVRAGPYREVRPPARPTPLFLPLVIPEMNLPLFTAPPAKNGEKPGVTRPKRPTPPYLPKPPALPKIGN